MGQKCELPGKGSAQMGTRKIRWAYVREWRIERSVQG